MGTNYPGYLPAAKGYQRSESARNFCRKTVRQHTTPSSENLNLVDGTSDRCSIDSCNVHARLHLNRSLGGQGPRVETCGYNSFPQPPCSTHTGRLLHDSEAVAHELHGKHSGTHLKRFAGTVGYKWGKRSLTDLWHS